MRINKNDIYYNVKHPQHRIVIIDSDADYVYYRYVGEHDADVQHRALFHLSWLKEKKNVS